VQADPSLVILSESKNVGVEGGLTFPKRQSALQRTFMRLGKKASRVLVLVDTPLAGGRLLGCLAKNPKKVSKCHVPTDAATRPKLNRMIDGVVKKYGARMYDPLRWFCTSVCPGVVGDVTVYQDADHVSRTYSDFLTPYVELLVKDALAGSP
jgi:5S rRNA maturation endonuclease (ribonuclease M5)